MKNASFCRVCWKIQCERTEHKVNSASGCWAPSQRRRLRVHFLAPLLIISLLECIRWHCVTMASTWTDRWDWWEGHRENDTMWMRKYWRDDLCVSSVAASIKIRIQLNNWIWLCESEWMHAWMVDWFGALFGVGIFITGPCSPSSASLYFAIHITMANRFLFTHCNFSIKI